MRLWACDFVQGRSFNGDKWDRLVQRARDADELIPRFLKRTYGVACEAARAVPGGYRQRPAAQRALGIIRYSG
jgi:hypothetical protein